MKVSCSIDFKMIDFQWMKSYFYQSLSIFNLLLQYKYSNILLPRIIYINLVLNYSEFQTFFGVE
jgi:hypothetical protein